MEDHTGPKILTRDCEAIRIPSGETFTLAKATSVTVTQALGGSFTIATDQGLARITDANADALGIAVPAKPADTEASTAKVEEQAVWEQLRTCYDPEIPVNIVDLGLVYDCTVEQPEHAPESEREDDPHGSRMRHGSDDRCGSPRKNRERDGSGRGRRGTRVGPAVESGDDFRGRKDEARIDLTRAHFCHRLFWDRGFLRLDSRGCNPFGRRPSNWRQGLGGASAR